MTLLFVLLRTSYTSLLFVCSPLKYSLTTGISHSLPPLHSPPLTHSQFFIFTHTMQACKPESTFNFSALMKLGICCVDPPLTWEPCCTYMKGGWRAQGRKGQLCRLSHHGADALQILVRLCCIQYAIWVRWSLQVQTSTFFTCTATQTESPAPQTEPQNHPSKVCRCTRHDAKWYFQPAYGKMHRRRQALFDIYINSSLRPHTRAHIQIKWSNTHTHR